MNSIGVIGFGALGRQVLGLLSVTHKPGRVVFFDDPLHAKRAENSYPFDSFLDPDFTDLDFYVALGYRHLARKTEILRQLRAANRRTPSLVHPSCHVGPGCRIGEGCLIYPLCNLDQDVEIRDGVLLNNSVVVSHDSCVGESAYLAPGVVLAGHVTIGEAAFLGLGARVANHRSIGARARIGIGTVVTRDVPDDGSAIGNPQRLLERPLELT